MASSPVHQRSPTGVSTSIRTPAVLVREAAPVAHRPTTIPTSKPAAVARQCRPELSELAESSITAELGQLASDGAPILDGLTLAWPWLMLGDKDWCNDWESVER